MRIDYIYIDGKRIHNDEHMTLVEDAHGILVLAEPDARYLIPWHRILEVHYL